MNHKIIGESKAATNLKKLISMIADSSSPVLIHGPTGTGKELVAEALHSESRRKGRFIALNCAAIPAELMEAELFGYEKGSFTGAVSTTKGKFEQSQNGTLFLDEIGDMPMNLQSKLLRVLENYTITRIGGNKEIKVDFRVVCASHKDLHTLANNELFRIDLLYRLNVLQIDVPYLHERSSDIPLLLEHFLNEKFKHNKSEAPVFGLDAVEKLVNYNWPGNIRELRNVIERSSTFFSKQTISAQDVETYLLRFNSGVIDRIEEQAAIWTCFDDLPGNDVVNDQQHETAVIPKPEDFVNIFKHKNSVDLRTLLRDIEIELIKAALNRNSNNTSEAAKDLKLLRTTLIEKIKKYGL